MELQADAVFDGGGVKAIAIAGALLEFAERGFRKWVDVAGIGFGGVVAAYLACGHDARDVHALLRRTPFARFLDRGRLGRGLARGEYFREWMNMELGGATFASVRRPGGGFRLLLIASDITSKRLVVMPDDLARYRLPGGSDRIEPGQFMIADAVHMSMSIPNLFEPVTLLDRETGKPATIVDGTVLANFPIEIFDRPIPTRPTFGFRLVGDEGEDEARRQLRATSLGWLRGRGEALRLFEGTDPRPIPRHVQARACLIPVSGVNARSFQLSVDQQEILLEAGRQAAAEFLGRMDES